MTEKEAWSKIRVINYLLQNIDDAMGERDVKTSLKYALMGIQEEGFIPAFKLIEKGDLLRIDIPGMFFLEFDPNRKAAVIRMGLLLENTCASEGEPHKKSPMRPLSSGEG